MSVSEKLRKIFCANREPWEQKNESCGAESHAIFMHGLFVAMARAPAYFIWNSAYADPVHPAVVIPQVLCNLLVLWLQSLVHHLRGGECGNDHWKTTFVSF